MIDNKINFDSKSPLLRQPTIVDEIMKQQMANMKQHTSKFEWFICVPNVKAPTWQQMMEIKHGREIQEARERAKEYFKK